MNSFSRSAGGTPGPLSAMTTRATALAASWCVSMRISGFSLPGRGPACMATLDLTGGELRLESVTGPLDVEARNTELTLDAAKTAKPPFRFNGTGGELHVSSLRTEARIDGRNTDIEVVMQAAAPLTIYNTGENINVTAPPTGYTLDAIATEGRLDIADGTLKPQEDGDSRVNGAVRGGGPTLSLRATRGDITVRKPEGK